MNDIAIKVEDLGKLYRIGQIVGYRTLRESLMNAMSAPFRWLSRAEDGRRKARTGGAPSSVSRHSNYLWALKDVSFEIRRGEAVGIIGRNGSGKTTILKVLSRITAPTEGYAEIRGRVGSLLEVGAGFHPELTGRENVYLNGAVLGMSRDEVKRKFDEIVSFAEIERLLDTPVKRYSSGMYVRLAFSVAAHLEPEILLIDEVLAVGDAEFQKKCLGKMESATGEGRTVLFVSHNMAAVQRLCQRTILLDQGKVVNDGATQEVVQHYLGSGLNTCAERVWDSIESAPGGNVVRLRAVRAKNGKGEITAEFNIQEPIHIEVEYSVLQDSSAFEEFFRFYNESGVLLFSSYNNLNPAWRNRKRQAGLYRSACRVPGNLLSEGNINVWAAVATMPHTVHARQIDAVTFHVFDPGSGGVRGDYTGEWTKRGLLRPMLEWETEYLSQQVGS
jgi:lipopolysaccharide transport system ATP-binding protein